MSILQRQVQSFNGLSDDNLRFLLEIIQRFMKPSENKEEHVGQDLIDADYDIDECNDEIAEMFGVCP